MGYLYEALPETRIVVAIEQKHDRLWFIYVPSLSHITRMT